MKTAFPLPTGAFASLLFRVYVTFGSNPQLEVTVVAFTIACPTIELVCSVS
jgi:hypothetical protein